MRCAIVLFSFAAALVVGGVVGFNLASDGDAASAFLVAPTFGAVVVALSAAAIVAGGVLKRERSANSGKTIGFILALVLGLWFVWQATATAKSAASYKTTMAEYNRLVRAGRIQDNDRAKEDHFGKAGAPASDPSLQANALWGLSGISFLALGSLVWALHRDSQPVRRR